MWDEILEFPTSGRVSRNYALVGKCGVGLPSGYSRARNLEVAAANERETLELVFNPSDMFSQGVIGEVPGGDILHYNPKDTYEMTSISRQNGTTAGGTTVVINGTVGGTVGSMDGFAEDTEVYIGGVRCATEYADIGEYREQHLCEWDGVRCDNLGVVGFSITCLTNKWTFMDDPWYVDIEVIWPGHGNALNKDKENVHFSYVDLWSSRTTWGGEDPPLAGDSVIVTQGQYIVLDITPPPLNLVLVYGGMLDFADTEENGDIGLNATYIFLRDKAEGCTREHGCPGYLRIGTDEKPYGAETDNVATITLTGDRQTLELPIYGSKVLAVRNSVLLLNGAPKTNWVRLSQDALYGDSVIHVRDPVNWKAGDEIVQIGRAHV